jgi:hypothetical protein
MTSRWWSSRKQGWLWRAPTNAHDGRWRTQPQSSVNGNEWRPWHVAASTTERRHDEQWECGMEQLSAAARGDAQRHGTWYDGGGKQRSDDNGEMQRQLGDTAAE